jgi:dynein heavy chain
MTLQNFATFQDSTRKRVQEKIKNCSCECRKIVKKGFEDQLEKLRRKDTTPNDDENVRRPENQKFFRIKESAYENLKFPDNMSYEKRSELRKECSRFIRFSYLIDFLALDS